MQLRNTQVRSTETSECAVRNALRVRVCKRVVFCEREAANPCASSPPKHAQTLTCRVGGAEQAPPISKRRREHESPSASTDAADAATRGAPHPRHLSPSHERRGQGRTNHTRAENHRPSPRRQTDPASGVHWRKRREARVLSQWSHSASQEGAPFDIRSSARMCAAGRGRKLSGVARRGQARPGAPAS